VAIGFYLEFAAPASLGLGGLDVFFVGLLCLYPATVFSYIMVFRMMLPKYARRHEAFMALFPKA
jgi:hypothetical protein